MSIRQTKKKTTKISLLLFYHIADKIQDNVELFQFVIDYQNLELLLGLTLVLTYRRE